MQRAASLFEDYSSHHRTAGNKWCHRLGIPMIMISLFGMLAVVDIAAGPLHLDAALILIAVASIYCFGLAWRFGLAMLVFSLVLYLVGTLLPLWLNAVLFVTGWVLQFVGHGVFEKKSPAFLRNLLHLLVGPIWIVNDVVPLRAEGSPTTDAER